MGGQQVNKSLVKVKGVGAGDLSVNDPGLTDYPGLFAQWVMTCRNTYNLTERCITLVFYIYTQ